MSLSYPLSVEIPLAPVAATRPRVSKFGTYYPPKYRAYLDEARELVAGLWQDAPIKEPVRVSARFILERPPSHYGTGKNAGQVKPAKLEQFPYPLPDVDNFVKALLDVLQPAIIADDRQVVELIAGKEWGAPARTVVGIEKPGGLPGFSIA